MHLMEIDMNSFPGYPLRLKTFLYAIVKRFIAAQSISELTLVNTSHLADWARFIGGQKN